LNYTSYNLKNYFTFKQGIEINVEGTASAYAKTIISSTHLDVIGSSSGQLVTSECKTSSQVSLSFVTNFSNK